MYDEVLLQSMGLMVNSQGKPVSDIRNVLKDNIRKQLRIQDEQVAINRYK